MRSFVLQGQQQKDVQGRSELAEGEKLEIKKAKKYSLCKDIGHTAPICHMKENIWEATSGVQKKKKTSANDLSLNPVFCAKN